MTDLTPTPIPAPPPAPPLTPAPSAPSDADADALLAAAQGRVFGRRLRLLAVALYRRVLHLLTDPRSRHAVEVAERFADGRATADDLAAARADAAAAVHGAAARATLAHYSAAYAAAVLADPDAWRAAKVAADATLALTEPGVPEADHDASLKLPAGVRAALIHDVLGGPPAVV
jgi:hypothetical protein